jgi:ABC-2 type transport system permease protein
MWQRGPQVPLRARFKLLSYQLGAKGKLTLASSLTVFVLVGGFIYYNTQVLNEFIKSDDLLDLRADYEKKYFQYAEEPIPTIIKVNANVDIRPTERAIDAVADITVVNKSQQAISKFLVYQPRFAKSWAIEIDGGKVTEWDEEFRAGWFEFDNPLQPGEKRIGQLKVSR